MMDRYEFLFRLLFKKDIKQLSNTTPKWQAFSIPYLDFLEFNKKYNGIDFEFKKIENVFKNVKPVEIISDQIIIAKDEIACNILNVSYITYLKTIVSQAYNVRFHEEKKHHILIKNHDFKLHYDKKNLIVDERFDFILSTSFINIYGRPYTSNKYWEAFPKFKLLKSITLTGEVRKIDVEKQLSNDRLFSTGISYGNLFD